MSQSTTNDTSTGQRAAIIAGLLGLIPALGLAVFRIFADDPPAVREQLLGSLAFSLALASPYVLALAISRSRNPAVRGVLLLALGILSLASVFLVLSPVTLLLLPATVALVVAAVRSLEGAGHQVIWAPLVLIPGLLGVTAIGFGLYALFQLGADEPRCWMLTMVGGREEWQAMAVPPRSETGSMRMGPFGPEVKKAICTSDIITDQEAAISLTGVGTGFLVLLTISRLGSAGRSIREQFR